MSDTDAKTKRPAPIPYRPPKDREAELHARIAASGLSINAFITACIFGRERRGPAERKMLARLLRQVGQIGDQLHELTLAGTDRHALSLEAAQQDLAEIRAALLSLMGRGP